MADSKISDLAAVTSLIGTDEFVLARSGDTKKVTAADLALSFGSSELAYAEKTSNTTISATTEATANTIATAPSVTLDGSTRVRVTVFAPTFISASADSIIVVLYDDAGGAGAASIGKIGEVYPGGGTISAGGAYSRFLTPSNATHVFSFRAYCPTGSGTTKAGAGGSGNFMPAYIRVELA